MSTSTAGTERRGGLEEVGRVRRGVHSRGLAGTLLVGAAAIARLAYLREAQVWYCLDVRGEMPVSSVPPGIEVRRAGEHDLHLVEQLPLVGTRVARRRLSRGAELWVAQRGTTLAFSCWVFRETSPARAIRGGWLQLPPGTVALEEVATAVAFRGRSIASTALAVIVRSLAETGVQAVVTKLDETNLPCRRAIERVGFRAVASMQLVRIGGRARVALHAHEDVAAGFLIAQVPR
jgi:hypothetical protein